MLKNIVATFQTVMGSTLSQQSAVDTISQWRDRPSHDLIFDSGRREVSHYFEAFDRLRDLSSSSTLKSFNNEFLSAAMDRLTHEFAAVLRRQSDQHPGPISATESTFTTDSTAGHIRYEEYDDAAEPPSRDAIDYLRNIAQRMSSSGNLRECVGKYKAARKSFLHAQLKRVRFHDLSFSRRSSDPNELRVKMDLWVNVCKICVKILFEREKKLCDQIFQGLDGNFARDECFVGTVEEFAIALFNFADAVSLSNQPYEKMESILGIFNSFVWVLPDVNQLFDSDQGKGIRDKCGEILSKVENEVPRMLHDFGKTVLDEISSPPDERGAVDPSTVHVMDQIAIIVKNKDLLVNLIKSPPSIKFGDREIHREALGNVDSRSFLDQHLILIVVALQVNLEAKCRAYKDAALGQLFVMNNVRFILLKVKENGKLSEMIGESYVRRLDENVKVAMGKYQDLTCGKFLACFEDEGLYHVMLCIKPIASKSAVRKRVKDFNALYEEFRALHTLWMVPDLELRDEVRVSLCGRLVPAYLEFLDKLRADPKLNVVLQNNVKYSGEDFEALILEDLFAQKENIA